jgi:hypothetical protein
MKHNNLSKSYFTFGCRLEKLRLRSKRLGHNQKVFVQIYAPVTRAECGKNITSGIDAAIAAIDQSIAYDDFFDENDCLQLARQKLKLMEDEYIESISKFCNCLVDELKKLGNDTTNAE